MTNKKSSEYCYIDFNTDRKQIYFKDKTDVINEESGYTTSKRGIKKVWDILNEDINEDFKFSDVINILNENNINYHRYCAID